MRFGSVMFGVAALLGAALFAAPAAAVTASSPHPINVRNGPGFQFQVIGQLQPNAQAEISGCVSDFSWCGVAVPGLTGWASAEYLVTSAGGKLTNLKVAGANLGIPVVIPQNTGGPVATPPVGAMILVAPTAAVVQPVAPPPNVVSFVMQQVIEPVIVDGEVVLGAVLPPAVPLYPVPASPYAYTYVNGQRVLVEPATRRIVYVVQ